MVPGPNLRPNMTNTCSATSSPLSLPAGQPGRRTRPADHDQAAYGCAQKLPRTVPGLPNSGAVGTLPGDVAKQVTTWFAGKASAVLTNVPGPRQQIYFAGKPLKSLVFWVPQSGQIGLGISIFSYNGSVTLGLMADEQLVPNPQRIIDGFERNSADLEQRLLSRLNIGLANAGSLGVNSGGHRCRPGCCGCRQSQWRRGGQQAAHG